MSARPRVVSETWGRRCADRPSVSGQTRSDRGSGTVLALAVIGSVLTLMLALATVGAAVAARQQAQLAADLGAVAGAQSLRSGVAEGEVCDRVRSFVEDNAAQLESCTVRSAGTADNAPDVLVRTSVRLSDRLGWTAYAQARAGLVGP